VGSLLAAGESSVDLRLQSRLEESLRRLAASIDKSTQGKKTGFLGVSETPQVDRNASAINDRLLQALLLDSMLVVPLASDSELTYRDADGEFSKRILLGASNLKHLRDELSLSCVIICLVSKTRGKYSMALEWLDLRKGRQLGRVRIPLFKEGEARVLSSIELLPPRNVEILVHAASHFGKTAGRGECWDLPAEPLKKAGFSVRGYDFGTSVPWSEALPGDVLTIDNGKSRHVMVLLEPGKEMRQSRILHQNWNRKRTVMCMRFPSKYPPEDITIWRPGVKK
jgi:hypothetical protein